eukprot:TRINITY_DN8694_c1_g1_i3.p1 TRINITY_DN8694_c1_g1~~TRINITY_DN8694_c1_g1_i3.p1  ORF type:complete len:406 (+),score=78.92 TRINITY_DN8694_c1_g1_i3:100-1317(+)
MAVRGKDGMLRSPTFFVGAEKQQKDLEAFQRREQQLAEAYYKNKPLCYNARGFQLTHPAKARTGHRDADATLESPIIVGVADGVSQIEEFGIDSSALPRELLRCCEELGTEQLLPGAPAGSYQGPIPLVREAFESTESLGSTTLSLALLDNSTMIHGKLHPMIAVISIGDCEVCILRRVQGRRSPLEIVFHTEMQRVDGHCQTPLQLARVDGRIDKDFHDGITIEVIERGSAVHCVSAYEGDILLLGSDGVFDNLFLDEVAAIANSVLLPTAQFPTHETLLGHLAKRIVEACHRKTEMLPGGYLPEAPIGRGGKMDDTSCVVAEVIEWTDSHQKMWGAPVSKRSSAATMSWGALLNCGSGCAADDVDESPLGANCGRGTRARKSNSRGRSEDDDEDSGDDHCSIS